MNKFKENLIFLTKTKTNGNQLAEQLNITRQTINSYKTGKCEPKYDSLIKISEIYNVSIDDLLKKDLSK